MTEIRLIELLSSSMSANGFGHIREIVELNKEYAEKNLYVKSAIEAMKQAVNEALDEAAEKGILDASFGDEFKISSLQTDHMCAVRNNPEKGKCRIRIDTKHLEVK